VVPGAVPDHHHDPDTDAQLVTDILISARVGVDHNHDFVSMVTA
jgi:hypothetical protein